MRVLECGGLTKRFGTRTALDGLHLTAERGEIAGLLGLNGAGKTTAMNIIATLEEPTSGTARVAGYEVFSQQDEVRRRIGYLSESNVLPMPSWTAHEYLLFFADHHGLDPRSASERIAQFSRRLSFTRYLHTPVRGLSGGTRRKVDLVRAVMGSPALLLLDEPTREMDIPTKQEVWGLLEELADAGTAILLASHDSTEIHRLCRAVTVLFEGRVAFQGSVDTLRKNQGNRSADAMIASLLTTGVAA